MTITEEKERGIIILHLHNGEAKTRDLEPLLEILKKKIEVFSTEIIINLKEINSIDSSGIGVLAAFKNTLSEVNGRLVLAQPTENVANVLKITQTDKVFIITPTIEEALKKF